MKFEIQDKPAVVDKNGNLLWVITRQNTPAESNPDKWKLPENKDKETEHFRERMQGLADLIAKLPVEEADKVIKDIEDKLGIVYRGVLYG